jgi:hypothetical protein
MDKSNKQHLVVIEGGRDDLERELVELLFKPYLVPKEEYLRLTSRLDPKSSRVSLTLVPVEPKSPRHTDALRG